MRRTWRGTGPTPSLIDAGARYVAPDWRSHGFNWHNYGFAADIDDIKIPDEIRDKVREGGERVIICTLAGVYAEARYRRKSTVGILLTYGQDDWQEARAIANFIAPGEADGVLNRCEKIVRRVLCEHWQLTLAVASVLERDGTIDGGHELLRDIVGWSELK
jgi:hypothetical protein